MKWIKTFEDVTYSYSGNDIEYLKILEDDITAIFVDMLDEYELDMSLSAYANSISTISISLNRKTLFSLAKTIEESIDTLHHFYDYLISEGFVIKYIYFKGGYILDDDGRVMQFTKKNWNFIEEKLREKANKSSGSFKDKFINITISITKK